MLSTFYNHATFDEYAGWVAIKTFTTSENLANFPKIIFFALAKKSPLTKAALSAEFLL